MWYVRSLQCRISWSTLFTNYHTILLWHQVEAASKYSTVDTLKQVFYFVPSDYKVRSYFVHLSVPLWLLLLLLKCFISFDLIWIHPSFLFDVPIYLCCNNTTLWSLCCPFITLTLHSVSTIDVSWIIFYAIDFFA
jgi:hypothetical protein